jgi:hypothetical protein
METGMERTLVCLFSKMVGLAGFEPTTSRTPSVRATKLRYSPTFLKIFEFDKNPKVPEDAKSSTPIPSASTF